MMKKKYIYYTFRKTLSFVLLFPFILSGCVRENLDDCLLLPSIRVIAVAHGEMTPVEPTDIQSLILYVFNKEGKFVTTMPATLNETVELDFPLEKNLHIVALANADAANETVTNFIVGNMISDGSISLKKLQDYLTMSVYTSPSDLFWGEVDVANNRQLGKTTTLEIKRIVSSVTVKIRGLKELLQTTDDNFKVVVETQYNEIDFRGIPSGTGTNYLPQGGTFILVNAISQYEIPSFNILSSAQGTNVKVKIYHNDILIDTISTDQQGNPLTAYNGIQTEIRINYIGNLTVTVISAEWGEILIWKDFG